MCKKVILAALAFLVSITLSSSVAAQTSLPPLSKTQVLALVAGVTLPENVVYDLRSRGVDFVPDNDYCSLLKTAGATDGILQALRTAKVDSANPDEDSADGPLLQHLSHVGSLIRSDKLDEAGEELTSSFSGGRGKSAVGFILGEILIDQSRYAEAGQIYSQILETEPSYPEVHVRLSLVYLNSNNPEDGLREAKAALAQNPENPPGHLNAGLALAQLGHQDAAMQEYLKSLAAKPDYKFVYYNMSITYFDEKNYDAAIENLKKALALDPGYISARYNLGVAYASKGDHQSAIREYREVKRRDPKNLEARQNLGGQLLQVDPGAAIEEFRELAAIAPDWPICHQCLGSAYLRLGRTKEAEKEYTLAVQLDPASTGPLNSLGTALETDKKFDEALEQYRLAEKLDGNDAAAFTNAGRVLILKKDFSGAISELRQAEQLAPANWIAFDLLGEALEQSGDRKSAILQYKQAVSLSPKELQARMDLADALQKSDDWVGALGNYRQAAADEPPVDLTGALNRRYDAQGRYKTAQQSFQQHLADLRAAGKSSEADALVAQLKQRQALPDVDGKFHLAMQASKKAMQERRLDDAETSAKQAVAIVESVQPVDNRLAEAVGQLGNIAATRRDFVNATAYYKRQLAISQQLYGPQSPMLSTPLQNLGMTALEQNDLKTSSEYLTQALDLIQQAYGQYSTQSATPLLGLSKLYFLEKDYPKSEGYVLHYVQNYEHQIGETNFQMIIPLNTLCAFYDQTANSEKSVSCHARKVSLEEKQFGEESPYLAGDLTAEAQSLRKLGRNDEAAKIEQRTQALQSAQTNPN